MDDEAAAANFRRWFGSSVFVEPDGTPLTVYHATKADFDAFSPGQGDAGFHFGTLDQARMRGGSKARLIAVHLSAQKPKRVRDGGSWRPRQMADARHGGYDAIVYLNRYEGIPTERIEDLQARGLLSRLDGLSDREFRRLIPEARDSYVVFEPWQAKSINNPGTWSRSDPRLEDDGSDAVLQAASSILR